MIAFILSSIFSVFVFREFFVCFLLGFVLSNYFKLPIMRVILIGMFFVILFESILYQISEFPLFQFYVNFLILLTLVVLGYFVRSKEFIASFFYLSYIAKRFWKIILSAFSLFLLYYLDFTLFQRVFIFLTLFFFSLPFISRNDNFETLSFLNGILLGYIFLEHKIDFVIFGGIYTIISMLGFEKLFKSLPSFLPRIASHLLIALILGISIYTYYHPPKFELLLNFLKYPFFAISIVLLHIAQIVIAFIPGHFVPFTAGYVFGVWGILVDGIGMLVGSFTAYYIAKIYGEKVVLKFVKKKDLDKLSKIINEKGIVGFYLLFLIPFTPKDAMCFVAGLLKIKEIYFLLLILFIRIPADSVIVLIGAGFKQFDPKFSIIVGLIGFGFILIYFLVSWIFKKFALKF